MGLSASGTRTFLPRAPASLDPTDESRYRL